MTTTAKNAVEQVLALRKLTNETGTRTTRSQNLILRNLSDEDLTQVAIELKEN